MDSKKKILFVGAAAAALAVVSLSVGLTLAYLMDAKNKENTVKVGYGDQQISEVFSEPSVQTMDNSNDKKVSVVNKSTIPVFARVYMNFSDSRVADKAKVTYKKNNDDREYKVTWADFIDAMKTDNNGTDWKYIDTDDELGGYFYYTKALEAPKATPDGTEKTSNLIEKVHVNYGGDNQDDSNIDKIQPYEVIVYSEVVQTVETGAVKVGEDPNAKTVYGYDYNKSGDIPDEWKKAWESWLKKNKTTP